MKDTVVVGLGNFMMQDESIGVRVAAALAGRPDLPDNVEAIELGVGGFQLLHVIDGRRRVCVIDCARMGLAPGTLRAFRPAAARSAKVLPRMSLHEGDVLETLELATRLGQCPADVTLYGVEPANVDPGTELTPVLSARQDDYVEQVMRDLKAGAPLGEGVQDA